jgi:phosphohistidine swiveling domain-containing protein
MTGAGQPAPAPGRAPVQPLVVRLSDLDRSALALAGGKASNLGELIAAGFSVPPGFCVTTAAYLEAARAARLESWTKALEGRDGALEDAALAHLAQGARAALLRTPVLPAVAAAIHTAYSELSAGADPAAVAVRSSATAEDLPEASFAGQQDTFLGVVGEEALIEAVRRCWASLWTERAVAYRAAHGIDQRQLSLAVVVQKMVPAATAGVLFTANPLTGNRMESVVDAAPGLGEALVAGVVNPDHFVVDRIGASISERRVGQRPPFGRLAAGATEPPACLSDAQVLRLADVGAAVEVTFGAPQDIEWAYAEDGALWLLQARPITTLFPLPKGSRADAATLDVYLSVNVAQGVLGPLTPAGIGVLRRSFASMANAMGFRVDPEQCPPALVEAAGRLFLKLTPLIRHRVGRRFLLTVLGVAEAQSRDVILSLLHDPRLDASPNSSPVRTARQLVRLLVRTRLPLRLAAVLLRPEEARAASLRAASQMLRPAQEAPASPQEALARAEHVIDGLPRIIERLFPFVPAGIGTLSLARRIAAPVDPSGEALLVSRGVPHNPTTEMDLELWEVARRVRTNAEAARVIATSSPPELASRYLHGTLPPPLGEEVARFLARFGFRGVAEIDVGLPRWRDDPTHVFGVISNYLRVTDEERAPDTVFRRAAAEAVAASARVTDRARSSGPGGRLRARVLRFLFGRARALLGMREAPKFHLVQVLDTVRVLLLSVGSWLVERGWLERDADVFFLDTSEIRGALAGEDCRELVAARRRSYDREARRRLVPRVLLSDGRTFYGGPEAAPVEGGRLVGAPASPGVYSGRARVVMDPNGARVEPGEVLVAPSTDPGWTPLFLTAGALVMEMGGMMSHGAVVAREYGIPAVVGASGATTAIETGARVTVDGGRGLVVVLDG